MFKTKYEIGDPVWSKMKGYAPWPSRIAAPTESSLKNSAADKVKTQKNFYLVYFFGSNNFAWMPEDTIQPFEEFKEANSKPKKNSAQFKQGLKQIEEYIADGGKASLAESITGAAIKNNNNDTANSPSAVVDNFSNDADNLDGELPPIDYEIAVINNKRPTPSSNLPKKSKTSHDSLNDSPAPSSVQKDYSRTPFKSRKTTKGEESSDNSETTSPTKRAKTSDEDRFGISSLTNSALSTAASIPKKPTTKIGARNVILRGSQYSDTPIETPKINMSAVVAKSKNIRASNLKFGFIGLGLMGQRLLKCLLDSQHKVTIWNRSPDKCEAFVEAGASAATTPADVVEASDIVFSCVSDPAASKELVFGNFGILSAIGPEKGYVEMSSIDPVTSNDISEAIIARGGMYLEAPMIAHGKQAAETGNVIIVTAGDRKLYEDCNSCFSAMGKRAFFLGHEIGKAAKMNLIFAMLYGSMCAALGECCSLIERTESLQIKDFKEILQLSIMQCPLFENKISKIIQSDTTAVEFPLDLLQKDLRLALNLTEDYDQSCPIAAITNEVFKATKKSGYRGHDVSAVYLKTRF